MKTKTMIENLCSQTILLDAWLHVKSKNSAGGVDGISINRFITAKEQHFRKPDNFMRRKIICESVLLTYRTEY
jgi:hypothetical protein